MIIPKNPATSTPGKAAGAPPTIQQPAPRPAPAPVAAPPVPIPAAPIPAPRTVAAPVQHVAPAPVPQQMIAAPRQQTQAVVKHTSPVTVPAFIDAVPEGEIAAGFENVGQEAYKLAMLGVAQPQSPQVMETRTLQAGDAYLTTAREQKLFGPGDQLEVIPFFYYKSYDLWNHRDAGGGLVSSSVDPQGDIARLAQRQLKDKRLNPQPTAQQQPEQAVESLVFLGLYVDTDEAGNSSYVPIAIPFTKSKYKKGVAWLQLAQKASQGKYPLYCAKYLITTVFENGKRGSFYNFDIDFSPNAITKEDADAAKSANIEFAEVYKQRKLQVQQDATDATPDVEIVGAIPASEQPKAY